MSTTLTKEVAKPLEHLLNAASKELIGKIVAQAFKQLHAGADAQRLLVDSVASALDIEVAEAQKVVRALRQLVQNSLYKGSSANVLPSGFHAKLGALLISIVDSQLDAWKEAAPAMQASLPRFVDLDWRVDVKTASESAAQMSVPTVLVDLSLARRTAAGVQPDNVQFELSRQSLQTLLDSLGKINAQLGLLTREG